MDPFTQRMFEKAEQRSRALGICSADASKFPLGEANSSSTSLTSNQSGGSGSGNIGSGSACATTMAVASQQQKQQLPLHTNKSIINSSSSSSSSSGGNINKLQVIEKKTTMEALGGNSHGGNGGSSSSLSPREVLRHFSAVDKENVDLGIEINIMTDKNVEVQVQVEEQQISDDDEIHHVNIDKNVIEGTQETVTQPLAIIRDTSRNRLQRLGALYSDKNDLSSPIHRTEGNFNAEGKDINELEAKVHKPKQRLGKLAALASTINQWEDDSSSHHNLQHPPQPTDTTHTTVTKSTTSTSTGDASNSTGTQMPPPPKPHLNSRGRMNPEGKTKAKAPNPPSVTGTTNEKDQKTKQLKWDPKVLNSLEAQGFQRRDSSTVKVSYDFKSDDENDLDVACNMENKNHEDLSNIENKKDEPRVVVGKLNVNRFETVQISNEESNSCQTEKKTPTVKTGLVSGRAAIFESQVQAHQQQQQKPQKDPTELTLKERMKLFEKNKGEALVPKAAFGMAPSISKILQDSHNRKDEHKKAASTSVVNANTANSHSAHPPFVKSDNKLRDKVAAIFSSKNENTIKEEIRKQREEDMQVLANRFNKQKQIFNQNQQEPQEQQQQRKLGKAEELRSLPPQSQKVKAAAASLMKGSPGPPPPPPPPVAQSQSVTVKRRSPGNGIEDMDSKCAPPKRIYPALSDLESNESCSDNDNNCCTTATVSGRSTADEMRITAAQPLRGGHQLANIEDDDDEDNEDSYMESEIEDSSVGICNGSLGREIMQVVQKNDKHQLTKIKEVHYAEKDQYFGDGTLNSSMNSESEASMGVDDYLDEALDDNEDGDDDVTQDEDDENNSRLSRNSKGTTASNSFSFRKTTTPNKFTNCLTINEDSAETHQTSTGHNSSSGASYMQPVTSELSINKENENVVTLVHTVSFYRRQQNSANSTPIRKICREQQVLRSAMQKLESKGVSADMVAQHHDDEMLETDYESHSESDQDDSHLVQEKIKKLLEEVCKQQQVIAQTSQALNLCAATIEFSGSTESVEGERHLLVATHRRQACLDEVQRLRVEKSLRPLGAPKEKGRLTVKEITVPLRQDYIRKLASDTISGHHIVCLLKYNEHVLATRTVPTLPGLLAVKFPDVMQLNNVYADFKVTLEIYGMTAQREVLPHEVKYHINLNKKSNVKTPKKKAGDNRLVMPPVQSPAGPHVVRTPALVQYGFAIFSLREIQRTSWTLTQVLGVSPLDGAVHMKLNCELSVSVEYRGFLTMFEDISGFGAWHRRWCHLNGTILNYWKYPDDEKKKTPMGSIDLYTCSSLRVNTAPRDICARLNTMLLECQRPALDTDEVSLVIVPNGRTTTVRYLLSADTKEEREEWCAYFNKALTLLRAWGPPQ